MFPRSIEVQMEHGNAAISGASWKTFAFPTWSAARTAGAVGTTEGKARRILNLTDNSEKPLGEWNTMLIEAVVGRFESG